MQKYLRTLASVTLFCVTQPGQALSQDATDQLPWLHTPAAQPPSTVHAIDHYAHKQHNAAPPPPPMAAEDPDTRDADDRKLNALAEEYYHISPKDARAPEKAAKLQKRVKAFHALLKKRAYGTADILKDTANLEHRIDVLKKKLAASEAQKATAAAVKKQ